MVVGCLLKSFKEIRRDFYSTDFRTQMHINYMEKNKISVKNKNKNTSQTMSSLRFFLLIVNGHKSK